MNIVIIGYGSIGRRHAKILKQKFKFSNIFICTKQNISEFKSFKNFKNIKNYNPDYIIIASETFKHLDQLNFIEKNFKNKLILVEKPIFHKYKKLRIKKNTVYVGYNLRFHPFVKKLKLLLKNTKVFDAQFITNSFLPDWRKNITYQKNYSALKSKGGGILLDLSHELDLANFYFKNLKIKHAIFGKKSHLKIKTEDYAKILINSKKTEISIDLKYYSRNNIRIILVDTKNFSVATDLIKNTFAINYKNKVKKIEKKFDYDHTYINMHQAILRGKDKSFLCKYNDAIKLLKIIKEIKNNYHV